MIYGTAVAGVAAPSIAHAVPASSQEWHVARIYLLAVVKSPGRCVQQKRDIVLKLEHLARFFRGFYRLLVFSSSWLLQVIVQRDAFQIIQFLLHLERMLFILFGTNLEALMDSRITTASTFVAPATQGARLPNFQSGLRPWLERLEEYGEIKHIKAPVNTDLESSTINYLVGKTIGSPALMFENLIGHPGYRALYNMMGSSLTRICLALGEQPLDRVLDVVTLLKNRMRAKIAPMVVDAAGAAVNQNILEKGNIDLTKFPAPRMWPLDGGRYLGTGNVVLTMDPETDRLNVGTYRQMLQSKDRVTVYTSPGKDGGLDRQKWWAQGKPAPVAVCYGIDPALLMVGGQSFPKTESEFDYYGGLVGSPIRLFKSELTGLMLPADAEIIAEGFFQPGDETNEGPFGEFTAYYGRSEGPCPSVQF
jgi:3-octaprenyl-4-hydroxybenzoate carboxy-lyase